VNFALSYEQELLKEAARGALARAGTVAAARAALDGDAPPDLWPTAVAAGWTGMLVAEEHGGAGLGALEAMLVFEELGRVLAATPLLGHLPATFLLDRAVRDADGMPAAPDAVESAEGVGVHAAHSGRAPAAPDAVESAEGVGAHAAHPAGAPAAGGVRASLVTGVLEELAAGTARAALVPARPPGDLTESWTTDPPLGLTRAPAPVLDDGRVTGAVAWVPDAPGADWLVVAAQDGRTALVRGEHAEVEALVRYDATRCLGHVRLDGAPAEPLDVSEEAARAAWHLAQALLAAESLGLVDVALDTSVRYARERHAFGRAIGSYQAIKHALVEVLRRREGARSLMYYSAWAAQHAPGELPLAAAAFRLAAGRAADHAARTQITVHGGIGATWEHDAPLYFRRAQLSRRLLGGDACAADAVAGELLTAARRAPDA
jgi:alkylation response protein AidB-like acyl-CoA dehydrogenase